MIVHDKSRRLYTILLFDSSTREESSKPYQKSFAILGEWTRCLFPSGLGLAKVRLARKQTHVSVFTRPLDLIFLKDSRTIARDNAKSHPKEKEKGSGTMTEANAGTHTTGSLRTRDHKTLFTQQWCIEGEPKASVLLVHGMAEHSSRYARVAEELNAQGYNVYTFDLRGHGRSEGIRCHVDRFDEFLDDLEQVLESVREKQSGKLFLMGHSMGGTVATLYTIRKKPDIAGLVLSAPALKPGDDITGFIILVARLLSKVVPKMPLQKLDNKSISRDPEVVKDYDEDPLNYRGGVRARIGAEMLRVMDEIKKRRGELSLPLFVFHGDSDKMISPPASQEFFDAAGSSDKEMRFYEGLYHEALNEPEKQEVIEGIVTWLDQRV